MREEKLANEVKSKSNVLVSRLTAQPYSDQRTLAAVGALRLTLNKIVPSKRQWGFWMGVLIGLACGLGVWYLVANNLLMAPK